MIEVKAPNAVPWSRGPRLFLAGSIEMGAAWQWQSRVVDMLSDIPGVVINPRRDDWDATWKQSVDDPRFNEQVEWELHWLERADTILIYFAPGTKSPISLLEFGLHVRSGKMVVCCPPEFWRRGNVEMVCWQYGVQLFETLDEAVRRVAARCEVSLAEGIR